MDMVHGLEEGRLIPTNLRPRWEISLDGYIVVCRALVINRRGK